MIDGCVVAQLPNKNSTITVRLSWQDFLRTCTVKHNLSSTVIEKHDIPTKNGIFSI